MFTPLPHDRNAPQEPLLHARFFQLKNQVCVRFQHTYVLARAPTSPTDRPLIPHGGARREHSPPLVSYHGTAELSEIFHVTYPTSHVLTSRRCIHAGFSLKQIWMMVKQIAPRASVQPARRHTGVKRS